MLDRFYGNRDWYGLVPSAWVQHLPHPGSDHAPILLHLRGQGAYRHARKRRPWCFIAHWIRNEECEVVIRDGWESSIASDSFDRLFGRIEACQLSLRQWSRDIHNNPRKCIEKTRSNYIF